MYRPGNNIDSTTIYYGFEYSTNENMANAITTPITSSIYSGGMEADITGLLENTKYYFRAFVFDSGSSGAKNFGTIRNFTTAAQSGLPSLAAPKIRVTKQEQTYITIAWNAVSGATSYDVYRNGEFSNNIPGTEFSSVGLTPGTKYSFYVIARNDNGEVSVKSNIVEGMTKSNTPVAPAAPTIRVTEVTATSISIAWDAVSGATLYKVYRDDVISDTIKETEFTTKSLTPKTTHSFYVIAMNADSDSKKSKKVTATTLANDTGTKANAVFNPGYNPPDVHNKYFSYKESVGNKTVNSWPFTIDTNEKWIYCNYPENLRAPTMVDSNGKPCVGGLADPLLGECYLNKIELPPGTHQLFYSYQNITNLWFSPVDGCKLAVYIRNENPSNPNTISNP